MEIQEQVNQEEAQQVDAVEQPAETDVGNDDAFERGFAEASGSDLPESAPEQQEQQEDEQPKSVGITEEQFKALMEKAAEVDRLKEQQSKVFGTLGAMRQVIDQLRQQQPQQARVIVSKDAFKRLSAAFPEMAEMLAEDLQEALQAAPAQGQFDPSQLETIVEAKLSDGLSRQRMEIEAKVLTAMHPDWRTIVGTKEFGEWKASLDEKTRQELETSWDAEFIGAKLSEFKSWRTKSVNQQIAKAKRLEAAVSPKGSPKPPAQTDDDAFIAGFKSARGIA